MSEAQTLRAEDLSEELRERLISDLCRYMTICYHFDNTCMIEHNTRSLLEPEEAEDVELAVRTLYPRICPVMMFSRMDESDQVQFIIMEGARFSRWLQLPFLLDLQSVAELIDACRAALNARYGPGTVDSPLWFELWPDDLPAYTRRDLHDWLVELGVNLS